MASRAISRAMRWALVCAATVVMLTVVAAVVLQTATAKRQIAAWIARVVSKPGGLGFEIHGLEGVIPTRFSIAELVIGDPHGKWVTIRGIEAEVVVRELINGRIHLRRLSAAKVELARLPRTLHDPDDEPFAPPRALRDLTVDALRVHELRVGRASFETGEDRDEQPPRTSDAPEWSAPVAVEAAGTYEFHGKTITARLALSAPEASGLVPPGLDLRSRDLRLTGAVEGNVFRPKGALVLVAAAPAYGEKMSAASLDVSIRGKPSRGGDEKAPYRLEVETTLREPEVDPAIDAILGSEVRLAMNARVDPVTERIRVAAMKVDAAAVSVRTAAKFTHMRDLAVSRLRVDLRDLGKLGGEADDVLEGGALAVQGRLHADVRAGTANGEANATAVNLELADPHLRGLIGPTVRLSSDFQVERGMRALHLSDVRIQTAHADIDADVLVHGKPTRIEAEVSARLDDLASANVAATQGRMEIDASMRGGLDDLFVEAVARAERMRIAHGPSFDGTLSLHVTDAIDAPAGSVRAALSSPHGRVEGGGSFALVAGEQLRVTDVALDASGARLAGNVVVDLRTKLADGAITGKFSDLSSLSPLVGARLRGSGDLSARVFAEAGAQRADVSVRLGETSYAGARGVRVKEAKVDAKLRDVSAGPGGDVRLAVKDASVSDVSIAAFDVSASGTNGVWGVKARTEGRYFQRFRLSSAATIDAASPALSGRVHSLEGSLGGRPLALRRELILAKTADSLDVEQLDLALGDARAHGAWHVSEGSLAGVVEVDRFPLDLLRLVNPSIDLRGTVAGRVTAAGTPAQPDVRFTVEADAIHAGAATLPTFDLRGDGRWNRQGLVADALLSGGEATNFTIHAVAPRNGGDVTLDLDGVANLDFLNGIGVLGEDRVGGVAHSDLRLAGTMTAPRLTGELTLENGRYENAALGAVIQDASARLVGDGTRLTLERLEATDGANGRIQGTGGVDFAGGTSNASYGVDVTLDSARVARSDELTARASGTIRLAGAGNAPIVIGEIEAERANIRIPERLPPDIVELEVIELNAEAAREDRYIAPEPPRTVPAILDLKVHMSDEIFVRGSDVDTEWKGDLRATGTARAPILEGKLVLVRGSFRLLNLKLKAVEGTIEFDGAPKIDPILHLVGEAKKHGIEARIIVSGRASKPTIRFTSQPPLPEDEILARLLFGKEPGQLSALESVQLAAALARFSGTGASGLDPFDWARRTFSVDTIDIETDEANEGVSVLRVGKYVTEDVFVSVNQGMGEDTSSASVEVDLTDNLTLESKVGRLEGRLGINWKWDY